MFYSQFAFKGISKCFGEFRFRDVLEKRNLERVSFVLNYSLIKIFGLLLPGGGLPYEIDGDARRLA